MSRPWPAQFSLHFLTARNLTILIGILLFCATVNVALDAHKSYAADTAESADDLRREIDNRSSEIKKIEQEIEEYKTKIIGTQAEKRTLQSAVQSIDIERAKLSKDIDLTEKKLDRARLTSMELGIAVKQKEAAVLRSKNAIADVIQRVAAADQESLIEVLLSHASLNEFFTETDDLMRLQSSMSDHIASLERLRSELAGQQNEKEVEAQHLLELSDSIEDQKRLADQKRREKDLLLSATKNKESSYKTLLADREKRKKQFETEVGDYEARLKAIIDPNSIPRPGTKVLQYPIMGNITLTQHFGRTSDAVRLYSSGSHNGIDLRAAPGTPILSAAGGIVMGAGDTDITCRWASYGKWILIGHDNGLATLYGHLDLIKVGIGQRVETGTLIGYSGNTGYSTGPHLHFTVFAKSAVSVGDLPSQSCKGAIFKLPLAPHNAYLDPESYL